ncbi:hypothetical protein EDB84DRAFT_1447465 [Lactarius hengduanensis]|nr:hypothetical protein EDB84DRAFT_1447465 [Lactarius hengduanensis]
MSVPGCIPTLPLKQRTHYLIEAPRQARVTHLVRCFSRSSAAHAEIFWDLRWKKCGVAYVVGLPCQCGFAFRPLRPWLRAPPVNSPSRGTSRVIATAHGRILGGQSVRLSVTVSLWESSPLRFQVWSLPPASVLRCLSRVRWGVGSFSCPLSVVFSTHATIFGIRYPACAALCATFAHVAAPFDPRLAASRLNFWASAADLFMGLGAFTFMRDSWCRRPVVDGCAMRTNCTRSMGRIYLAIAGLWPAVSPSRRAIAHGLLTREEDVARGSHQLFLRSARLWRIAVCLALANTAADYCQITQEVLVPERLYQDDGRASLHLRGMNLAQNAGGPPCEYLACRVVYDCAITTISSGEEMETGNGGIIESNVFRWTILVSASAQLTVSSRRQVLKVVLVYSSLCPECATMGSVVGEQQEKGMFLIIGFLGITLPPCTRRYQVWTFACLRGNDQRLTCPTYARLPSSERYRGSKRSGCLRFGRSPVAVTFEYGFGIEIRVLRWGLG